MAVTNLTVLENDQATPPGWTKINVDLNEGVGGEYLYFAYEKDGTDRPITDIYFLIGQDQPTPPGYEKIDVDLNRGAGGAYIYATFTRAPGDPIQELTAISSNDPSANPPNGFKRIDVDLNTGAGGKYIYLCYRT
ncbi:hypothetical protein ACFYXD_36585 [Streptomyces platensis]|uniref:hypothetical protein n=1 Tax=Streptomyces platensis TaxID=58346 RepID=UPI003684CB0C